MRSSNHHAHWLSIALVVALTEWIGCPGRQLAVCEISSDCRDKQVCYGGSCLPACATRADCGTAAECRNGACLATDRRCVDDRQCLTSESCVDYRCAAVCVAAGDCPSGTTCRGGLCLTPDADARDAAVNDGATDDVATSDGTRHDRNTPDATLVDGSVLDNGAVDRGGVDLATWDHALPDTAPLDSCVVTCGGNSVCQVSQCLCPANFDNCDNDWTNGCETDLRTSMSHCGACYRPCTRPHATATCSGGACHMVACTSAGTTWDNCNGIESDGCETQLGTDSNCALCGDYCEVEWCRYCDNFDCKPDPPANYCG